jgi:hypothetical protein
MQFCLFMFLLGKSVVSDVNTFLADTRSALEASAKMALKMKKNEDKTAVCFL